MDECEDTALDLGVSKVPTFVFYKSGKVVSTVLCVQSSLATPNLSVLTSRSLAPLC